MCHGVVSWLCHMPSVCDWAWVALPSIVACSPPEEKPLPTHRPIRAGQNVRSAPPRGVGRMESRDSIMATQRHTLIFLLLRNWKLETQLSRNAQKQVLGFSVACNANFLTKYPKTGYRFTVMYDANSLTKRLETGYRFSVPCDANFFTERPDSGGA